jgi:hypothetical protein
LPPDTYVLYRPLQQQLTGGLRLCSGCKARLEKQLSAPDVLISSPGHSDQDGL